MPWQMKANAASGKMLLSPLTAVLQAPADAPSGILIGHAAGMMSLSSFFTRKDVLEQDFD